MTKHLFVALVAASAAGLCLPATAAAQRSSQQYTDQYDEDQSQYDSRDQGRASEREESGYERDEYRSARSERSQSRQSSQQRQEQQDQRQAQQRTVRKALDQLFEKNDDNEDGHLSRDELPSELRDSFQELDSNSDDKITRSEMREHSRKMQRMAAMPVEVTYIWICGANCDQLDVQDLQQAYQLMQQVDVNNDGRITRSEVARRHQQVAARWASSMVERCDENDDGQIDKEEAEGTALSQDFDRFDRNEDGSVTARELRLAARSMEGGYSTQEGQSGRESGDEQSGRSRTARSEDEQEEYERR